MDGKPESEAVRTARKAVNAAAKAHEDALGVVRTTGDALYAARTKLEAALRAKAPK